MQATQFIENLQWGRKGTQSMIRYICLILKITFGRGEVELFNKVMVDNSFPHWDQALSIATKLKPANDFLQTQWNYNTNDK